MISKYKQKFLKYTEAHDRAAGQYYRKDTAIGFAIVCLADAVVEAAVIFKHGDKLNSLLDMDSGEKNG